MGKSVTHSGYAHVTVLAFFQDCFSGGEQKSLRGDKLPQRGQTVSGGRPLPCGKKSQGMILISNKCKKWMALI